MAMRRRQPTPRKPTPATDALARAASVQGAPAAEAGRDQPTPADDGSAALRQRVADDFLAKIRSRGDLSDGEIESLVQSYGDAVRTAELTPTLQPADRGQWVEMVDLMVKAEMLPAADAPQLIRSFDDVFGELGSREFATLVEFSRRCRQDGQERAVEWLEGQRAAEAESKRATGAEIPAGASARASARIQRGRRTRGPPL